MDGYVCGRGHPCASPIELTHPVEEGATRTLLTAPLYIIAQDNKLAAFWNINRNRFFV